MIFFILPQDSPSTHFVTAFRVVFLLPNIRLFTEALSHFDIHIIKALSHFHFHIHPPVGSREKETWVVHVLVRLTLLLHPKLLEA